MGNSNWKKVGIGIFAVSLLITFASYNHIVASSRYMYLTPVLTGYLGSNLPNVSSLENDVNLEEQSAGNIIFSSHEHTMTDGSCNDEKLTLRQYSSLCLNRTLHEVNPLETNGNDSQSDGFQKAAALHGICKSAGLPNMEKHEIMPGDKHPYFYILSDEKTNTIYCAVSKCASTSWKSTLLSMRGVVAHGIKAHYRKRLRKRGLVFLNELSFSEAERRLRTYFKYLIVRHPLDRFVSAYRHHFLSPDGDGGTAIMKNLRKRQAGTSEAGWLASGSTSEDVEPEANHPETYNFIPVPSFDEVIQASTNVDPREWDRHFLSAYHHCHPCHVKYDFVAQVETLSEDLKIILANMGLSRQKIAHDNVHSSNMSNSDMRRYMNYYENVTVRDYRHLVKAYRNDLLLFGYDEPVFGIK